jgi:protein O-GlcNAc transferase
MDTIQNLFNTGNYEAISAYIETLNKNTLRYHYLKGVLFYAQKDYNNAYAHIMICHNNDSQNLEYLGKLIEICNSAKDNTKTIDFCRKYLSKKENSSVSYIFASCLIFYRHYKEALLQLEICFKDGYNIINALDKLLHCAYNLSDADKIHTYCNEYLKLKNTNKNRAVAHYMLDKLFISGHMTSIDTIIKNREIFNDGLSMILTSKYMITNIDEYINPWTAKVGFPLSYHHLNNKDIFKKLSKTFRTLCPDLNYVAKHCSNKSKNIDDKHTKLRVGFISAYFRDHSVAKDRRGIIKLLNRDKYEVYSLFINDVSDKVSADIWENTIPIKLNESVIKARDQIESLELDILVYCEIGMSMIAYILSHYRLAPIQVNTWGHSDTSGVDTIDYYISSKLYETSPDPQSHYSETLIMNEGLCTYYYNPIKSLTKPPQEHQIIMNVFKDKHRYVCPASLIKLHPTMDIIFKKLLSTDKDAVIIMIDDNIHRDEYEKRLKSVIGDDICRIGFMPAQYIPDYFTSILMASHVVLDSYPFGGCNTSLEAFAIGKPVVTLPGEFINGRFTYGFYKKMEMMELIANDIDNYVDIAVKLASDKTYYDRICMEISLRSPILYENLESVKEWDDMLSTLYRDSKM